MGTAKELYDGLPRNRHRRGRRLAVSDQLVHAAPAAGQLQHLVFLEIEVRERSRERILDHPDLLGTHPDWSANQIRAKREVRLSIRHDSTRIRKRIPGNTI